MTAQAVQTRADAASDYLQHLEELAIELRAAMGAIASNSLSVLEDSVSRQEMICARLVVLAKSLGDRVAAPEKTVPAPAMSDEPLQETSDSGIENKINATSRTIRDLNLEYASLLKHSGRTIALLSSLCRSHKGHFPEARGSMLKHQTWSCQM